MSTVVGTFSSREQSRKAVRASGTEGFTEDEISVMSKVGAQQAMWKPKAEWALWEVQARVLPGAAS